MCARRNKKNSSSEFVYVLEPSDHRHQNKNKRFVFPTNYFPTRGVINGQLTTRISTRCNEATNTGSRSELTDRPFILSISSTRMNGKCRAA